MWNNFEKLIKCDLSIFFLLKIAFFLSRLRFMQHTCFNFFEYWNQTFTTLLKYFFERYIIHVKYKIAINFKVWCMNTWYQYKQPLILIGILNDKTMWSSFICLQCPIGNSGK